MSRADEDEVEEHIPDIVEERSEVELGNPEPVVAKKPHSMFMILEIDDHGYELVHIRV